MNKNRTASICVGMALAIFFCGCALRHTKEISRLQEVATEGDAQARDVERANAQFEALVFMIAQDQLQQYQTQQDFTEYFGPPVFIKEISGQPDVHQMWLYRYQEKMWGSEKVYLYFDASGSLVRWEHQDAHAQ